MWHHCELQNGFFDWIDLHFIFLTPVITCELFMYVYSYCNALSVRFFAVDRALNAYIMIMIMDAPVVTFICQTQSSNVFLLYLIFVIILFSYHYSRGIS